MYQLLFIDDDEDLLHGNRLYFQKAGYRVKTASNPADALALLEKDPPDCIILDVMLPQKSGFSLYHELRAVCAAPVIFLSGRAGEEDRIHGLMLGGGDYITKPYSLRELEARIQVQLRAAASAATVLSFPPISLDLLKHKAYRGDREIPLSNLEYQLLHLLVEHPGEVVPFAELGQAVWGYYSAADRRTIMVAVSRLRKKLELYAQLENAIETVWSKGYKFVGVRRQIC